ncbi:MAG: PH domain-containing protein [Gemmataceae bacterium]|nr:PH domain-containing protein [Gemmataceae bacterium]
MPEAVPGGTAERPARALIVPPEGQTELAASGPAPAVNGNGQATRAQPLQDQETEVFTIQPLMFRRYPGRCTLYVLMIVVGVIGLGFWLVEGWSVLAILGVALAVLGGLRLLTWWLRNRHTSLTATNKRLILRAGALTSHSTEIPYAEITDVQAHQGLFNRLMDVGDITLTTNLLEKKEIVVMGVPDPEGVAEQIRKLHQP